jgi:hypothetical protein
VTFPAAEDDPDPFESQDAESTVVGFALLALGLVEGFSPLGAGDRFAGELVKGLAEKLWAEQSTMNPAGFSTAFNHGSNFRWYSGFGWRQTNESDRRRRHTGVEGLTDLQRPEDSQRGDDRDVGEKVGRSFHQLRQCFW